MNGHPSLRSFEQMQRAVTGAGAGQARGLAAPPPPIFGVWRATATTPYGPLQTELILQPNLRFSQVAVLAGMMTYDAGIIGLLPGVIHFTVQDHEPKEYHGTRIVWLESWTYLFRFVDANTITFEDRLAHTCWNAQRA